jgi:prophage DNA circulation protein
MSNPQNPSEAAAMAKFTTKMQPKEVDTATQNVAATAKANPLYAQHPEIQQGITAWLAASGTVDQTWQKLVGAHAQVTALIAALKVDVATWRRASQAVVALVNTASAGSAQAIAAWGFATTARTVVTPTLDPPTKLRVTYSRSLAMTIRWAGIRSHVGYAIQIGDGTPTGWGAAIACPRASYQPTGLTPGQKVAFRVQVIRKNGPSNWSDALLVTVR